MLHCNAELAKSEPRLGQGDEEVTGFFAICKSLKTDEKPKQKLRK